MIVIVYNIDENRLSEWERSYIISSMMNYTSLPQGRIRASQHKGYVYKLSEDLKSGKFIAVGGGKGFRNLTYTIHIKYILGCNVLSSQDPRILNLSAHALDGVLSDGHGHHDGQWFAVAGYLHDNIASYCFFIPSLKSS